MTIMMEIALYHHSWICSAGLSTLPIRCQRWNDSKTISKSIFGNI